MTSPTNTPVSPSARRRRPGSLGFLLAAWVAGVGLSILPALHGGPWVHDATIAPESSPAITLDFVGSLEEVACPVCLAASQARNGLSRIAALEAAAPPASPLAPADRTDVAPPRLARSVDAARAPPIA
jgi:hypothetical protein